jgi:cytochrome c oxidase cbb3-type subunit II
MRFLRVFPIIIGFSFLFGVAFTGLVIAPGVTSDIVRSPTPGLVAYTATEAKGRQIYVREGCVYCHSQQVRNVKADASLVSSFGVSKGGDYFYDRPHLLGTSRQGPDLSNEGRVWQREMGDSARDYLINHFINPRQYNPASIMPAFNYLSAQELSDLTDYIQSLGAWKDAAQALEESS